MFDKELRQTIGKRAKQRRKELQFSLQYVAERMDVTASTIQRYESGAIDNTKKLIVEGLADVLHVSPAWLRGETEEMGADQSDDQIIRIENTIQEILASYPLDMDDDANGFSKNVLLLLLMEFRRFNGYFQSAFDQFSGGNEELAKMTASMTGIGNQNDFNRSMFTWTISPFASALNQIADTIRSYANDPERAQLDIASSLYQYIHSDRTESDNNG